MLLQGRVEIHDLLDGCVETREQHVAHDQNRKRTSDLLRSALAAMEEGKPFSDALIAEYRNQLLNIETGHQRMEELLQILWAQVEEQ